MKELKMDLVHKIDEWYKEKGIRLNFNPEKCSYNTWFGREVPIVFDDKIEVARYESKDPKIRLPLNEKVSGMAISLIHEAGHANIQVGKHLWTDWTYLPAVGLAIYIWGLPELEDDNLINSMKQSFLMSLKVYGSWWIVNETLAETYRVAKLISSKIRKIKFY